MSLFIGLMSGTSMDGIDAALVDVTNNKLLCAIVKKYSNEVITGLNEVLHSDKVAASALCQLNTLIGRDFAAAVAELLTEAKIDAKEIQAIGSHGQTICHDANADIPYTLQLGCAHTIAHLTKIPVVADFRIRDLVNGGQGAPFAPIYHYQLFAQAKQTVAVVNIGGIANVSFIKANQPVTGWDVGPGNCLMDDWIGQHQSKPFDANGSWASQGEVISELLDRLLSDPFVCEKPPKSIDKHYYSLSWLNRFLKQEYKPADVQASLLAFTAHCIANTVLLDKSIGQLFVCGGGSHNLVLLDSLSALLPQVQVQSSANVGVDPDYVEAMLYAWLAAQNVQGDAVDLSSVTGSGQAQVLGALYSA